MGRLYTAQEALDTLAQMNQYQATPSHLDRCIELFRKRLVSTNEVYYNPQQNVLTHSPIGLQRFWSKVLPLDPETNLEERALQ